MLGQSDPDGSFTAAAFRHAGVDAGLVPVVDWSLIGELGPGDMTIREVHRWMGRLHGTSDGALRWCAGSTASRRRRDPRRGAALPGCCGIKIYPAGGWQIGDPAHRWLFGYAH